MPIPTDPLLSSQWHLLNTTPGLLDLNVTGVWDPTQGAAYTGVGTRTVVIDSGFDYTHPDLAPNYDQSLDFDFESNTLDAFGFASQPHGTAVAGIIGADNNGTGAVGVAFDTSLVGYRTANFISDAWLQDIRDAIHHAAVSAQGDVANISQGIANDSDSEFGAGYNAVRFDEIEASIGDAVNLGRSGLGMTLVKSAGNSRADSYDVNADDWTNDTRQVVVAAVDQNGFVSSYSSFGAANLVSGFGTPGEVLTTDRVGDAGYNSTDFTGFNGTSAAAPMVTGVVALMYDANAGLGWRDVQSILASSARHVGSDIGGGTGGFERFAWGWNGTDTWNGGGLHFSNDYGYGLVDALAAVRLAETWLLTGTAAGTTGNEVRNNMDVLNSTVVVPDGNLTGLTFSGNAGFNDIVDRVTVQMSYSTTYIGDLEIYLTSPNGTVSQLINDVGGSNASDDFSGTWTFESQAFRGERAAGTWSVRVVDDAGSDVLTVSDVVIRTFGSFTTDDRYIFTNEYSNYAGIAGHATAISDTNGGTDTVNAAAVSSASNIRLDGTLGSIDGVSVSFTNIEHAIGGDGSDTLVGNGGANQLYGMRGNDQINAGGGADITNGGDGNDTVFDDDFVNFDAHNGGAGIDWIDYAAVTFANGVVTINLGTGLTSVSGGNTETISGFENARGSQGGETIIGTTGVNILDGQGGDDTINGGDGSDTTNGGAGNDTILDDDFVNFDVHNGGAGTDWIDYSAIAFADGVVTINLGTGLTSVSGGNTETISGFENARGSQGGETIIGTAGVNILDGQGGNDILDGQGGNDTINGGGGSDTTNGGADNDTILDDDFVNFDVHNGGVGTDWIDYSAIAFADGVVTINLATGLTSVSGGNTETISNFENARGSQGGETIIGTAGVNILDGQGGNDTLNGGAGNDTLIGGAGNDTLIGGADSDTYVFDTDLALGTDTLDESGGGAADTLDFSATTTRSVNVNLSNSAAQVVNAGLTLVLMSADTQFNNVIGGSLNDTLTGNSRVNALTGGGGNDTLSGGAGNDTLSGGAGNDTLTGGAGNDTLTGGADSDTYVFDTDLALGTDTLDESGGGAADTLDFSATTTRSVNVNLSNSAAQVVNAGLTLVLMSADTQFNNVIGGSLNDTLTGNSRVNALTGGGGNDTLSGGAGNDTLSGGAGNDTLTGGAGNDTLTGGADSDTYVFDTDLALGTDTLDESGGGAADTLDFSATTTRSVNVNLSNSAAQVVNAGLTLVLMSADTQFNNVIGGSLNDTLTGNSRVNALTGGGGNDTLSGGAGNDTLSGGAGNDTLTGGAGNDTQTGGAGNDTYLFDTDTALGTDTLNEAGGGVDTLNFSATTTRALNVNLANAAAQVVNAGLTLVLGSGATFENVIGGSLADTLTGNGLANTLTGGGGNDTLSGGAGNDTLTGGAGNDTQTGGAGNDTYLFDTDTALGTDTLNEAGGGVDTLNFSATTTRALNVNLANAAAQVVNPGLTLALGSGSTFENVVGGSLDDTLIGNALANTLTGGGGNDTLIGGASQDTFRFVSALNAATNVDFVVDFFAADDRFLLDDAVFAGIGAVGQIAAANFVVGAAAGDASDRVIYDSPTGHLFFDSDGTGAGAQVLFANVVAVTTVTFNDIWIS